MNDWRHDPQQGDEEDYTYEAVASPYVRIAELEAVVARLTAALQAERKPASVSHSTTSTMMPGIPATRICRLPSGRFDAMHCALVYTTPMSVEDAIARARTGKTSFVRREDAHQVLDALGVTADHVQ